MMSIITNKTFQEELNKLKQVLEVDPTIVVDVETNGLDSFGYNQICGIGLGESNHEGLFQYYPIRHHQGENLDWGLVEELISVLNQLVKNYIGYNIKFDLHFLEKEGLEILSKKLIDVIVMVRLIEHSDTKELALTPTGKRNYGEEAVAYDIETKKLLKSNKWNKDFSLAPPEMLGDYCKKDVLLTARIYTDYLNKIQKTQQLKIFELECDLTKVLYKMEQRGISIDKQYAKTTKDSIISRLENVQQEIHTLAGQEFNISSPKQIGEIFNNMGIESPIKTPKGQDSWNEAALININHRMAGLIRQYRTIDKLRSTYIDPYLEVDTMHTNFCNWGTATGRLSSREPNLQNIPRNHFKLVEPLLDDKGIQGMKDKIAAIVGQKGITMEDELSNDVLGTWSFIGDESYDDNDKTQIAIRRLFIPRPNYTLVGFDYQQMEVRVFMSYFRNEIINAILNKDDVDFHGEAAKLAFNINEDDEQYKFYRQMAKAITFGTIYGIGNKKLSQQLGTTPKEAGKYKKQYFEGMKGSKDFFDKVIQTVESRGWIKNRYGRKYLINKDFAYKGVNYLVQGTSADLLSERMLEVDKYLEPKKSNMLLQVHDEIICEIHNTELDSVPYEIRDLLQTNSLNIPLVVDMEMCSPSWASKKDLNPTIIEDWIDWENLPTTDKEFIDW